MSLPGDAAGHPEPVPPPGRAAAPALVPLATVLREWGRIGCIGFGGPPTHIKLLRELCVERRKWLDAREFEDAITACNLLPGPASTQLAIFCAWRVRSRPGALAGGAAFIVPGLIVILALSALFLAGSPPLWVLGAGAGAGAAAIGAILGSAIPLTRALTQPWQYAVLGAALILMLALRRGVVLTLIAAGAAGTLIAVAGGPLPH